MKTETATSKIGKRIRRMREERQLAARAVADKLGISRQMIYAIESGNRGLSVDTLEGLSDIFKVGTDELLGRRKKTA